MQKALKIADSINEKMAYIAMATLFILMCLTTVDTITRKTPLGGITDSLDLTELFLVIIIFCTLAFLESERGHIRVDIFVNMFPGRLKKITESITYLLSTCILFLLFYSMLDNISDAYQSGTTTLNLGIPHWPFVVVVTAAIFLYAFTVLLHMIEVLIQKDDGAKED